MKKVSKTNWQQLAKMDDDKIDTSDIAELDDDFFVNADIHVATKKSITIR